MVSGIARGVVSSGSPVMSLHCADSGPCHFYRASFVHNDLELKLCTSEDEVAVTYLLEVVRVLLIAPRGYEHAGQSVCCVSAGLFRGRQQISELVSILTYALGIPQSSLKISSSPGKLTFNSLRVSDRRALHLSFSRSPALVDQRKIGKSVADATGVIVIIRGRTMFDLL